MDFAVEAALDGGFEEVQFAHGDAAGGEDDVDGLEGGAEGGFEGGGAVEGDYVRMGEKGRGRKEGG